MAIGALGVGWLPIDGLADVPLVHALRTDTVGAFVSRASVILGGALLLQTWLVVGADVLAGHVRDIRRLWAVLAIWIAPFLLAPPLFSRDAYSYFAQGKLVLNGVDPYTNGVQLDPGLVPRRRRPMWSETPTPYGPFFLAMIERGIATLVGERPYLAVHRVPRGGRRRRRAARLLPPAARVPLGIDPAKALWLGVHEPARAHALRGRRPQRRAHDRPHHRGSRPGRRASPRSRACGARDLAARWSSPSGCSPIPFVGLLWAGRRPGCASRVVAWVEVGRGVAGHRSGLRGRRSGVGFGWVRRSPPPARCARGSRRPPRSACSAATCSTGSASATTSTPRWRCPAAWA